MNIIKIIINIIYKHLLKKKEFKIIILLIINYELYQIKKKIYQIY